LRAFSLQAMCQQSAGCVRSTCDQCAAARAACGCKNFGDRKGDIESGGAAGVAPRRCVFHAINAPDQRG
jgi:hypothetical protein